MSLGALDDRNPVIQIYLDTNVYSGILDGLMEPNASKLRATLTAPGVEVRLSPTNILEILATPDPFRREQLVYLTQQIGSARLLLEVESIITHYIAEKSGLTCLKEFLRDTNTATGALATAWTQTKADRNRTLLVADDLAERFRSFRLLFDAIHAHFRRGDKLEDLLNDQPWLRSTSSIDATLKLVASTRRSRTPAPDAGELDLRSKDAAVLLMLMIVCATLTPFEEPIDRLWRKLDVPPEARVEYAFRNFSFLLEAGPIVGMALGLAGQWLAKSESGNAFDLYHVAYLPLMHVFFTNDNALLKLADILSDSEPFARVKSFSTLVAWAGG